MRCDECLPVLEEYIDKELEQHRAEIISAHLAACSNCSAAAEALKVEQQVYARYDRDLDINPRLWDGIAARIGEDRPPAATRPGLREWFAGILRTPRLSPAFVVLLVLLAIVITAIVIRRAGHVNQSPTPDVVTGRGNATAPTPPSPQKDPEHEKQTAIVTPPGNNVGKPHMQTPKTAPRPEELIRDAERKYEQAIAILSRDVNRRRPGMDPQTLARFDLALASIDRTITETRQAARQQPRDPVALQYLLAAYSRKVDVLREMTEF